MLQSLPKNERVVMVKLRNLILESLPRATEYLSMGVPFYRRNNMICFIWPPTVYFGSSKKKDVIKKKGITLGFWHGNLMSNDDGALLGEGRKQVYCMYFQSIKEINDQQIKSLLYEAEIIDEGYSKKKKMRGPSLLVA